MNSVKQTFSAAALVAGLLSMPSFGADGPSAGADSKKPKASQVEAISGSSTKKITLAKKASERLGIEMALITADAAGALFTPYASLIYDVKGGTWVYTSPQPMVFVRQAVVVSSVKGKSAALKEGPAAGTSVVVVGAAELYGVESGLK